MGRVAAQGDLRPMAASHEAMEDLRRILDGRAAFYSKADLRVNTGGKTQQQAFDALCAAVVPVLSA
jgi:XRE family aerobic/anaerobic benzoate catabolism transcriptional regulator